MAFQPVIDLAEHRIDAYEALVRGPDGQGAGEVLAQLNAENLYAFDQACRVRAIEMAARHGVDSLLNINIQPNDVDEPRDSIRSTTSPPDTPACRGSPSSGPTSSSSTAC